MVLIHHPVDSLHSSHMQIGCRHCRRMSNPLYYLSDEFTARHTHLVMYTVLQPYHDSNQRLQRFMNLYREETERHAAEDEHDSTTTRDATDIDIDTGSDLASSSATSTYYEARYICQYENLRHCPSALPLPGSGLGSMAHTLDDNVINVDDCDNEILTWTTWTEL